MIRMLATAALTLSIAATPALARDAVPAAKTRMHYDAKKDQYCVKQPAITGSFLNATRCHSREEWAALGVTIPGRS